jgi:hypothetical protein
MRHRPQPEGPPFLDIEDPEAARTPGDMANIQAYARCEVFLAAFTCLDPKCRHTAMMAYVEAHTQCEAKA